MQPTTTFKCSSKSMSTWIPAKIINRATNALNLFEKDYLETQIINK